MKIKRYVILTMLLLIALFLVGCSIRSGQDSLGNEITIIDRVAFTIFGRNIYWYAICILIGIMGAYFYGMHVAKKLGVKENDLFDGFIWGVLIGVLGSRLYYVIFSWKSGGFSEDPLRIFTGFVNEEGGLAIHGAVIAASIFTVIFCKKRKMDIYAVLELLLPGFLIGQIAGRWGNFFNQEAHGGPISASVAEGRMFLEKLWLPDFIIDQMYLADNWYNAPIDSPMRNYMHPTFLYESAWNFIGLMILLITRKYWKKYWLGDAALFYLVWYGVGRFFVESIRTDALMVTLFGTQFRQAQVISVVMVVVGIVLFILRRIYKFHPVSFVEQVELVKNGHHI
ncbi:MAG TPA: prolipoprotein diacylglyceryl transferase [Bacilli bacterium]|nr:MAG: Prolipoprotein diacylglyceryl transferase [Tenericutes bacterium ADurb.BinA124]HOH17996.1 prolipoprotein diacylglyceryl transferase [Bacilli bacterium]HPN61119.1 prolipoprotein diacylglyceryl transferase [Bacilli bacterium]HPX84409.1 prolipoprotein diacylglyceryl transferase [Bacilli bacterium]